MPRTLEVESRGRTCPDRRDLGATEEQEEGSTGRSPNLHFLQRVKVSSVMGSQYLIIVEFLKRPVRRKISKYIKLSSNIQKNELKRTTIVMKLAL